jgi:RNA polymerase sigma factor (sigma-70 family)
MRAVGPIVAATWRPSPPRGASEQADDRRLLRAIVRRDVAALGLLYKRYAPVATTLAHGILRQRNLAEETVQEAFLAVWRFPVQYRRDRGTVRSWLMSTVHHEAVDLVRREQTQRKRADEQAADRVTSKGPPDPADLVVEEIGKMEARNAVRRALRHLRPEQRQIIELMYLGGLSQRRISTRLSLPLGTVKSRSVLGMRRLRAALKDFER